MKNVIIGSLLSLSMSPLWAQLTESDTLKLGYKIAVNGSWITGNVERLIINNNLDLSHVGKSIGLKTSNSYTYGKIFKRETENDIFSRNFLYLNPRKRLYPYAMLWLQNSTRQRIEFRYQAGVGVTYGLIRQTNHHLKISTTITHEKTRYDGEIFFQDPKNLTKNIVDNWRSTFRLLGEHKLFKGKIRAHYETWYQPALDDRNNWRYFLNAALELPISKHISFRSSLIYSHDNIVLTNIKRDDKIVTFGLSNSKY
jgi:hypothetical protein